MKRCAIRGFSSFCKFLLLKIPPLLRRKLLEFQDNSRAAAASTISGSAPINSATLGIPTEMRLSPISGKAPLSSQPTETRRLQHTTSSYLTERQSRSAKRCDAAPCASFAFIAGYGMRCASRSADVVHSEFYLRLRPQTVAPRPMLTNIRQWGTRVGADPPLGKV